MHTEIYLFAKFCYNYPHNFIHQVWSGSIADHLQSKFNGYYSDYGSRGVMLAFYNNLDLENMKTLENWIKENYKG